VWIDGGIVHVHSPNKSPFELRTQLARTLGLPPERIVVECTSIGGDFGGKGVTLDEFACYFLARACGRPVRYVQTYAEELRAGPTRHHATVTLRTAVDADGTFLAHHSSVVYDGGAYAAGKPVPHLLPGAGYGNVPYRIPDVRLEMCAVYTNTLPAAHVRGPGETQTFFAWEQHVDAIAVGLGIDPLELRLRNVITDGDTTLAGDAVLRPMGREVLGALQAEIAALPAPGAGRGRGISLIATNTGGGKTSVRMRLEPDDTIAVILGVADQGAGAFTAVQRIAAVALGVPRERIRVRQANTGELPYDPGAGASRITYIVGRAVQAAAETFRRRLDERIGAAPVDVTVPFESDPAGSQRVPDYTFAAYAIDVAVDAETGTIGVTGAVLVADVGTIINPVAHRGQIDGGFVCGFGVALMEERPLDESGKPLAQTLGDYKIPTIRDVPALRTVYVPSAGSEGPLGAKMVGELSNAGVPPAIANAVYAAAGVRLFTMPLRAEDVFRALQDARSE
jgi:CO/xanthine dehydrogenase Mo-binding subunit